MKRVRLIWVILGSMILVSILPLIILGVTTRQRIMTDLQSAAEQEMTLQLEKAVTDITGYVETHVQVLKSAAAQADLTSMDPARQQQALISLVAANKEYCQSMGTIGPNGMNVARSDGNKLVSLKDRAYFTNAMAGADQAYQTTVGRTTGRPTLIIGVPIRRGNQVVGVLYSNMDLEAVTDVVDQIRVGETGYVWLADSADKVMAHPDKALVKEQASMKDHPAVEAARAGDTKVQTVTLDGTRWLVAQRVLPQGWVLAFQMKESEALVKLAATDRLFRYAGAGLALFVLLLAWALAHNLSKPVQAMAGHIAQMAKGDFTRPLTIKRRDELGAMADALRHMQGALREYGAAASESATQVRKTIGELGTAMGAAADSQTAISTAFSNTLAAVESATGHQQERLDTAKQAVEELVTAIDQIAGSASHQAGEVSKAATVVDEAGQQAGVVSNGIGRLAYAVQTAESVATTGQTTVEAALTDIQTTKSSVESAADTVHELGKRSEAIGQILQEISAIADQTNLLALNAAIEAARAGEAGRGFAVVSEEVRRLADRSVRSAKEIEEILSAVQAGIKQAASAMETGTVASRTGAERANEAQAALSEILSTVKSSAGEAHKIQEAVQALVSGHLNLAETMRTLAAVAEENSASAEEMAAGSETVRNSVQELDALAMQNFAAIQGVGSDLEHLAEAIAHTAEVSQELSGVSETLESSMSAFKV